METTVYESRARELISEIKKIIEVKGLNLDSALEDAGISPDTADNILNQNAIPSLSEFLALCEISGITIHLPSIETPNTPM
ncbi:helix-turn-helix domain-containing protein [Dyadobacter sp. CY343]|uniref:helix-turn-helix domain-containing protein n=1 Tax=Dyadobacter sp. CY343 TaxID=2907299 RepID=UPI001F398A75|nr:helix-turn-helix domain-containing protein [Dyadobacter sp. CY343]MCE7059979.1 helix-turn-helix domain-containing protein [Dyadobacter sp. CY343]